MIQSGKLIENIIQNLSAFREELKSSAKLNLLNQNIHSENFIKDILNIVFNLSLEPLNTKTSNYPGLDLGDEKKQGIAFQITSQNNSKKINETLQICIKEKHYKKFKKIKIFILSNKQKSYHIKTETQPHFLFDKNNILDFDDLFLEIKNLEEKQLKQINDLICQQLPNIFSKEENHFEQLPELILELSDFFRIDMTDEEIEIYLMEAFHLLALESDKFQLIKINQEAFFKNRLKEIEISEKSVSKKKERIEIKLILNEFSKLKKEVETKIKMFYHTDKYPISKSYSNLVISLREIVEKLSFPHVLIEETVYENYFTLRKSEEAHKFQGKIKFEIFKNHKRGNPLICSVWLTKQEIIEIKSRQSIFNKIDNEEFFKSSIYLFTFEAIHFNIETLTNKVLPSFIDKLYDFKNEPYNFLEEEDYSTWTDLTNYQVGLG